VNRTPIRLSSDDTSALMVDSEPLVFQSLVQIREGALPPISHVPPFRAISLHWNLPCCSARHFKGNEQDGRNEQQIHSRSAIVGRFEDCGTIAQG
jgi:hypothetical protein